jgi:hypothetical protein
MTDPKRLQQAVDEFYELLDSMRFQSVNQVAELSQLKVLVAKYPEYARQLLDQDQHSGTATDPSPRRDRTGRHRQA